ncbi:MAG: DUF2791 family P-loop domain-containing protein [Desulfotomaculaceae bacterium]|nr:DUF2791 family P-loop domain-containing protein [Desulfotomaculaceae bacterium]
MEPAFRESALESLRRGEPPLDLRTLKSITLGEQEGIWHFWRDYYLDDYIACGGSKVKFLTGKPGSGKTHALLLLLEEARQLGYVTFFASARHMRLNKFDSIYQAVLEAVDVESLVSSYCANVIRSLGYEPVQLNPEQDFFTWAQARGRAPDSLRREIQEKLDELYLDRKLNHNFALAFTQLCAHHLGSRRLADEQKETLQEWLKGRPLPARSLKPLKIFTRIDKYNARHMMASFLHLLRLCGRPGLCAVVDDLNALLERGTVGRALYGKAARNEVFESLRQLVDDFAGFAGAFFVFAGRNELIHDAKGGFISYTALWMRIRNEVSGQCPNKFADLFNQDHLVKEIFTGETCLELQQKINEVLGCNSGIRQEDFHCLVESVSMLSPVRRVIEAIVNQCDGGGIDDG